MTPIFIIPPGYRTHNAFFLSSHESPKTQEMADSSHVFPFCLLKSQRDCPTIDKQQSYTINRNEELPLETWIIFIILYGLLKGAREPITKRLLRDVNVPTSLFAYTFIGFLMAVPSATGVFDIPPNMFGWIVAKSTAIFIGWSLSFTVLKKLPVSTYGVGDMSRVIFSTLLGVVFLHEALTLKGMFSLILVVTGLYLANRKTTSNKEKEEESNPALIWLLFLSCFLNAIILLGMLSS